MKKQILTIAIVLGLGVASFAQGGMFMRGEDPEAGTRTESGGPMLPAEHGQTTSQDAPVGSGIAVLTVLGGAYLVGRKRREE